MALPLKRTEKRSNIDVNIETAPLHFCSTTGRGWYQVAEEQPSPICLIDALIMENQSASLRRATQTLDAFPMGKKICRK